MKPKLDFGQLKKIIAYGKKYLPALLAALFFAIITSVLYIIGPRLIENLTNTMVDGIVKPEGIDMAKLYSYLAAAIVVYGSNAIAGFMQRIITNEVTHRLSRKLRSEIGSKINRLPLAYFDKNATGDIISRVSNDVDTVSQTLGSSLAELLSSVTLFVGVVVMMFVVNAILALVTIGSSVVGFIAVSVVVATSHRFFKARQACLGEMNGNIEEVYSNHKIVKAFNAEDVFNEKFHEINSRLRTNNRRAMFLSSLMGPIMNFAGNLSYVLIFIVGVSMALSGTGGITFGIIISFTLYARLFSSPLQTFAQSLSYAQQASAAAGRVFEMIESPEMEDESSKNVAVTEVKGAVTFDHVKFSYDETREIIHDFSAELKPGMKIAIVGPTGAGKTTIVNLLMRFYDVNGGAIRIDGVDIRDYKREQIHDMFDMILQDTWLIAGTVRENLVFNTPNIDEKMLDEVVEAVGLDHFVAALPNGYDSKLDDSSSLSEGQKQQLTIARAVFRNAPMLILDEATSSVDTRTERKIQQAMDELTKGRTSFIIAHRLSTIRNADIILVMKDGDIVEQGKHDELLAKGGFYAELYNSQFETTPEKSAEME